jgi:hypothetical protein
MMEPEYGVSEVPEVDRWPVQVSADDWRAHERMLEDDPRKQFGE